MTTHPPILPAEIASNIDMALSEVPDDDTAAKLRTAFADVYAQGHRDGRLDHATERSWRRVAADRSRDQAAPT